MMRAIWTTRAASQVSGASLRQLQYWDETDVVQPSLSRPASDTGHLRLYGFQDLVELRVLVAMRKDGLSLQRIRRGLIYLRFRMPSVGRPLREMVLQTDGQSMFALVGEGDVIDTLSNGQHVCTVAFGRIIDELQTSIKITPPDVTDSEIRGAIAS